MTRHAACRAPLVVKTKFSPVAYAPSMLSTFVEENGDVRQARTFAAHHEHNGARTKEIINLIQPKVVLLVGAKAQGLLQGQPISDTVVKCVAYPLGGGITLLEQELREIIRDEKL